MEFSPQDLADMDDDALEQQVVAVVGHRAHRPVHTLRELFEQTDSMSHTAVICSLEAGLGIKDVHIHIGETDPARVLDAIRQALWQAVERARWAAREWSV